MPFEDDVAIICNDEGKMRGMPLNRGICSGDGTLMDIIAGPFFIAYAPVESERFLSMPKELEEKYTEKFRQPEQFSEHLKASKLSNMNRKHSQAAYRKQGGDDMCITVLL